MLRQENLSQVQEPVKQRIYQLDRLWMDRYPGDPLVVVAGYRSPQAQATLTSAVTNAPPGYSFHQYGLAVDVVPSSLLSTPNWSPDSPLWPILGALGESVGLEWGGRWSRPDRPHFEYHPGLTIAEVKDWFEKTGEVLLSKLPSPEVGTVLLLAILALMIWSRGRWG